MIETIILEALTEALTVPVYMEAPLSKPERYVLLEKTGTRREDRLDTATFAVQSIAATLLAAAELNEAAKQAMDQLPYVTEEIFAAKLNSDGNFTDTRTKERRYQAVYNITFKE